MKNSASEIFCLNHQAAYQHAFRFIRQLAIHLRNSMKLKTKVFQFEYLRPSQMVYLSKHRSRTNKFIIGNMSMPLIFGPWSLHELAKSKGLQAMSKTGT
jgi:Noc2p family